MTGEILQISFLNDHKQLRDGASFGSVGGPLTAPHWVKDRVNNPVSYTVGTILSIEVKAKIRPAGKQFKLFGIDKKQMCFNFESAPTIATGSAQTFKLKGKAALPGLIDELKSSIVWNLASVGIPQEWANLGTSGEHSVFVLLADPILKNSMGYPNQLTVTRIRQATTVASGLSDVNRVAARVHSFVNGNAPGLGLANRVNINYGSPPASDAIWSLLDGGTRARGHCGEASYLMEQMLRLLGIRALQKHVYGRTDKGTLDRGENLVWEDESTGKMVGNGAQVRTCKEHGEEKLWLNFSSSGYSLNWAEGTVEVNGKLYGGLVNEVGEARGSVSASQDLLLKLEKDWKPKFQTWSANMTSGCELAADRSGAGDPFPPVPAP